MNEHTVRKLLERPPDFLYAGDNKQLFKTWTLGPVIDYRDADSTKRAMYRRRIKTLEKRFDEDFLVERFNHFAVGWVENLTYRVLFNENDLTSVTPIAKYIAKNW